jgi:hypothetical protein
MLSEQAKVNIQASRIRSALEYCPDKHETRLRRLWHYGLSQELVMRYVDFLLIV